MFADVQTCLLSPGNPGCVEDNGDGTVTDHRTGLQWAQKTTDVSSGVNLDDPHDVDNTYAWNTAIDGTTPNGTAFTDFLNRLNGGVTGVGNCTSADGTTITGGFAGHYDWRLPTSAELQTIVDVTQGKCGGGSGACIDPVFGPTVAGFYWSATTYADNPFNAWCVDFYGGGVNASVGKINVGYVRAVRTGS